MRSWYLASVATFAEKKFVCIIRAVTTSREKVAAALPNWNEENPLYHVTSFFYHQVLKDEFMAEI